jgi:hypothetical protein
MKKTLLLAAALACSGVVAQEKEIWACQQTAGTMLNWENSSWRQRAIIPVPLLLTIDGENSSYKEGDTERGLDCSKKDTLTLGGRITSCLDDLSSTHILMGRDTGRMGMSELYGVLSSSS